MDTKTVAKKIECRVSLRALAATDAKEFLTLTRNSRCLHHPWIHPPLTQADFNTYLKKLNQKNHESFVVCVKTTGAIAGVINLNNIARSYMLSASLGYYAGLPFAGAGYMQEGLQLVIQQAFHQLRLHKLEAYAQATNFNSLRLLKRNGFVRKALAPSFLFIDGAWRDHERWILVNHRKGQSS